YASLSFLNITPTSDSYTLSLHDALPILTEDLEQHDRWRPLLHDLGSCEVIHGVRIDIANLYLDEVGNPELPKKFRALKTHRTRRSEEHTSELQSLRHLVCRLLLEKKKKT